MNIYEELLTEANDIGLVVKETSLQSADGRCKGERIAVRKDIPTIARKSDVLAEELGHYHTTVGNIIEQDSIADIKQESSARFWAYNRRIGLLGIVNAYKAHYYNIYDMAEYLEVSEPFLADALECYRQKYGRGVSIGDYYVRFEPNIQVFECFLCEE